MSRPQTGEDPTWLTFLKSRSHGPQATLGTPALRRAYRKLTLAQNAYYQTLEERGLDSSPEMDRWKYEVAWLNTVGDAVLSEVVLTLPKFGEKLVALMRERERLEAETEKLLRDGGRGLAHRPAKRIP